MKIVIAGSTGMVGSHIQKISLASDKITEVISLVRKSTHRNHPKLKEIVIPYFEDYTQFKSLFKNVSAAFFCIGVYTGQVKDDLFKKITVDYAYQFAKALKENSPDATLCLLSGAGSDRTEKSRAAFARYKGMAENLLDALDVQFYSFRPAYIYPVEPRKEPNFMYRLMRSLYPILKLFGKNTSITSEQLADVMFQIGLNSYPKTYLENRDIVTYFESSRHEISRKSKNIYK